ncbi:elongation factor P--(R)-beta-lysine ligase [Alteromonas sp. ASW11-19]|uniref:Elongation factor P--(R)-beta-lysine ligase n=1 Tax=Alteromonas salexigens TaxID=2982530 RepID=A0ABT2VIR9_9ALTE|nr:elongation factor P--(R)-beta-lysine ligase [Alteromonas salexigens]MCU7553038.1 elongation factor P--(R)-beta-lysine ligase [Alteromonas salexigens]
MTDWTPTTSHTARLARAALLKTIRHFFDARGVLEVDTPLLSQATVTDVHLDAFNTTFAHAAGPDAQTLWLQTSPEYAMKRLLCADSGPIYQICKAFRHEGAGRFHNPEFTMLEWYRPGFDHHALMDEVDELLVATLQCDRAERLTYQQAFQRHVGIDPLTARQDQLITALDTHQIDIDAPDTLPRDSLLQLLFSMVAEPLMGQQTPVMIYSFPASQAALARVNQTDPRVADRFEVYFKGIELANGFFELGDASEQRQRFNQDNQQREANQLPQRPADERLLSALDHGLPDCAGVALGIDRLLILATGASAIDEVLNFPVSRA